MHVTRHALLLGTALVTVASAAHAQSSLTSDGSTYLTPMVVSTGGSWSDPFRIAGAVSTIGADEIGQFGGKNLDDVLRATPGTFTRDNVQNQGLAVNIRGLEGSGRVNMMIDGVKQNFRFTGHEAQGFTYIDPAFISGIDISRGAVTGVGGGALAGSANFRTLGVDDLVEDRDYGGFVTGTLGTNNSGGSGAAAAAFRVSDTFALLAGVSKRQSGDYSNGNGEVVPHTGQDVLSGIVKLEITPDAYQSLVLGGNFYSNDFYANSYFQTVGNRTLFAKYAFKPDDNDLVDLKANVHWNTTRMEYTGVDPNDPNQAFLTAVGRVIEDNGRGFDVSNTSRATFGELGVEANYGIEYFLDDYVTKNSNANPVYGINPTGQNSAAAVFASTEFTYDIVEVTVGGRYDHFTVDGTGGVVANNPFGLPPGPFELHRSEGRFNPKVTVALNPVDWFQPYVTYAESSRAPTLNEMLLGGAHPGTGPFMSAYPNPFLRPEVSKGWELGANLRFDEVLLAGDSLRLKGNYFHANIEDYITGFFFDTGMGFSGFYFDNNPGISTVQGVELQAAYDAGVVFASAAYTYTDAQLPSQINGAGAQSYMPDHVFTATAGVRLLEQQNLTLGARFYAVSESFLGDINVPAGNPDHLPGYNLADLFANYEMDNGLELGLNVTNVFDTAYTPALSTSPWATIPTGRGRTVQLTAKASF